MYRRWDFFFLEGSEAGFGRLVVEYRFSFEPGDELGSPGKTCLRDPQETDWR